MTARPTHTRLYALAYTDCTPATDCEMEQMAIWVRASNLALKPALADALDNSNSGACRVVARFMCEAYGIAATERRAVA